MFPLNTKILIVDDIESIRQMVLKNLNALGYHNVKEAKDGLEAHDLLRKAVNEDSEFQLVISDWNMPRLKGIDLLKKIRKESHFKKLPFILLTSESESDLVVDAVISGVSQYIVKPIVPKVFEEKLKSAFIKHYGF